MKREAQHWVNTLGMQPHPEGGYFVETYRSSEMVEEAALPGRYPGPRHLGTAIYFLIPAGACSRMHWLRTDEIWHFYQGGPLAIHLIHENGASEVLRIGPDGPFQVVVPAGCWFGARPEREEYSLVGCTMAPGFHFDDFVLGEREALLKRYPQHAALIRELT